MTWRSWHGTRHETQTLITQSTADKMCMCITLADAGIIAKKDNNHIEMKHDVCKLVKVWRFAEEMNTHSLVFRDYSVYTKDAYMVRR